MRGLIRLPEPQIITERRENWTNNFIASGNKRPDSSKYGNPNIRTQLDSMSYHKCFYCETKLKGKRKEVDHHIEVSVDKTLAFEWGNLYLSCTNCNNKIPHSAIPINEALNPCVDSDERIKDHLTFDDEVIQPKDNSELGLKTIQKYRLDSDLLDNLRLKQLKNFHKALIEIRDIQQSENRSDLTVEELNILQSFKRVDNSFSLMFEVILDSYEL